MKCHGRIFLSPFIHIYFRRTIHASREMQHCMYCHIDIEMKRRPFVDTEREATRKQIKLAARSLKEYVANRSADFRGELMLLEVELKSKNIDLVDAQNSIIARDEQIYTLESEMDYLNERLYDDEDCIEALTRSIRLKKAEIASKVRKMEMMKIALSSKDNVIVTLENELKKCRFQLSASKK